MTSLQTRMQILHPTTGGLYTGITNAVSTIYRIEGWRTLWKGVSSVIVGAGMLFFKKKKFLAMSADEYLRHRPCTRRLFRDI